MLTYSFHISQFISFPKKNSNLAQFIPEIYNKIIIKILGYFWGVTEGVPVDIVYYIVLKSD